MTPPARTSVRRLSVMAIVAVVALVTAYIGWTAVRASSSSSGFAAPGRLDFVELRDGRNQVQQVRLDDPGGERTPLPLNCLRFYAAAGTAVCMKVSGVGPSYAADILDATGSVVRSVGLPGIPSRARVSASGRIVTWTSFVTGDSYAVPGGFSTRTGFLDLRTGELVDSLETFATRVGDAPLTAADRNYWGLSVADDDRTVYVTVASGGHTWLGRGDLSTRTIEALRPDAECPSLSPDGSRIAYKKRLSRLGPWELAILDLATGEERRLPGTAGADDQAEWLDDERVAYGAIPRDGRISAILVAPADGSTPATVAVPDAASPSAGH